MEKNTKTGRPVIQINFKKRSYKSLGGGLYYRESDATYWERPMIEGRRTIRKLKARTAKAARLRLGNMRDRQAKAEIGHALDPYKQNRTETLRDLADFYLAAECPKRDLTARAGVQLTEEKHRVEKLVEYFGRQPWTALSLEDCRLYHHFRLKNIKRKDSGHRTVDLELQCLSSIFRWAQRNQKRTGVTSNPFLHERPRFQSAHQVRHCRDLMPASGDELHLIALTLFQCEQSQVLGWQALLEAFIGQRTHEILKLRWDAKNEKEPGYIRDNHLFLFRSKTSKGTFPYIEIHPALGQALTALKRWHDLEYRNSPWFFPSPTQRGTNHVDTKSLTKALKRVCRILKLPHRTSHGLRSFFVNVLRSDRDKENRPRLTDAEIALRIGQKTGKLIVDTYGEILPYKLSWLPEKHPPAWIAFLDQPLQLDLPL